MCPRAGRHRGRCPPWSRPSAGLALFGVIGVFVKQLFWPSDSGKPSDKEIGHDQTPFGHRHFHALVQRGLLAASAGSRGSPCWRIRSCSPVGDWWSSLWTGAFGALGLLRLHVVVGMAWIVLYAAYLLVRARAEARRS